MGVIWKALKNTITVALLVQSMLTAETNEEFRSSHATGLLWAGSQAKIGASYRAMVERAITDQFENQIGRPIIKPSKTEAIPEETFRLEKIRRKVGDLNDELIKRVSDLSMPAGALRGEVEQMIEEQKKLTHQLPRGTFGPEIQLSRWAEALWFWRTKKWNQFYRVYKEAIALHPRREINLEKLTDETLTTILESDFHRLDIKQKVSTCSLAKFDKAFELDKPTWFNGFKVKTQGSEVYPGNYLVVRRDEQGSVFEKFLRCDDSRQSQDTAKWVPVKNQLRLEHLIPSELDKVREVVILSNEEKGLQKYSYSSSLGLRDWSPEEFETKLSVPVHHTLPIKSEEKWYNNKTYWWLAGVVLATSSILMTRGESQPAQGVRLKLGGVP